MRTGVALVLLACWSMGCVHMKPSQPDAVAAPIAATVNHSDPDAWRANRPPVGPLPRFVAPAVETFRLANGVRVYVVENHAVPLVHVRVVVSGAGAGAVAEAQAGLPGFVTETMRAGTRARSGSQLEDELARLGATLGTKTESDWSALSLDILRDKLPQGIELLSEIVTTPAFERASVELVRARIIGAIDERQGDSKRLALDHLQALIYGHSALGLPAVGTRKTVERITAAEVAAFYRAYWQPASVSLVVAGDVTPEAAKELLSPAFARWTPPRTAPNARPPVAAVESSRRVVLVDQPAAKQSTVCIGFPTVPRSSPHWPAIEVVNRVLGGAYSSRINLNIREDKGYSYNIRSALAENRGAGELYIRGTIVIDKTVPAVVEVLKELDRLRSQPPTDAELESGKALAIGLATRLETNAQLGDVVTRAIVFGLPLDHLARYVEEVRALTRDQALEAANAYFGAARASIVVLGPAARLRESLSAAGFGPVEKP